MKMINGMSARTRWAIGVLLFMAYGYMAAVVMSGLMADLQAAAPDAACAKALDLHIFGFTMVEADRALQCMGDAGRAVYRAGEQRQDVAYPIVYGLFLLFTIWALSGIIIRAGLRSVLMLLPVLTVLLDFWENALIVELIDQFPQLMGPTVARCSMANSLKWGFAFASMLSVLMLAGAHAHRQWKSRTIS